MQIGIDAGGSLIKIATLKDGRTQFRTVDLERAAEMARSLPPATHIYLTGCRAQALEIDLPATIRHRVHRVGELDAFWAGARRMLTDEGRASDAFVLVAFGTGTSVFTISDGRGSRAAGTAVGGGTITGLSDLLLGTRRFDEILDMAERGNRRHADLMVSDLYPDSAASPVLGSLTAANFGGLNIGEAKKEDIASAILQLVVETISVIAIQVARTHGLDTVVIAGSPSRHPLVRSRFLELGALLGHNFFAFLEHGPYCGALGAIELGSNLS